MAATFMLLSIQKKLRMSVEARRLEVYSPCTSLASTKHIGLSRGRRNGVREIPVQKRLKQNCASIAFAAAHAVVGDEEPRFAS